MCGGIFVNKNGQFIHYFLVQNKESYEPLCKVPLMTSSKEEQKLIATSNKVGYRLI